MRPTCLLTIGLLLSAANAATVCAQDISLSQPKTLISPTNAPAAAPMETASTVVVGKSSEPLPLAPPRERAARELLRPGGAGPDTSTMTTIVSSLAVVLGLFAVFAWFMRRSLPQSMTRLPSEAVEQLGRVPLSGKQNMHLVRVGGKLLLVVVTPFGAETLTEITDPEEVARLSALCKSTGAYGPTAEFRSVLQQFEREPAGPGFLGNTHRSDAELANGGAGRGRSRGVLHA